MRHTIVMLMLFLAGMQLSGQTKNDTLTGIDQKVIAIDQDTNYWLSVFTDAEFLDSAFIQQANQGYGTLTGFFKNGKLCKIRELIGIRLTHDLAITDYYFSGGQLMYIREQEIQGPEIYIDHEGTVDHRADEPSFEALYYFSRDRLIQTAEKGKRTGILLPNPELFLSTSKEEQLLTTAKKYYSMLTVKYKQ